jgi:hypothetical protein
MRKPPSIRYRCPAAEGSPMPGHILMGTGPRVRRAYRVLSATRCKGQPALGIATWRLTVEPMSAERGREATAEGTPTWGLYWDRRERKSA